MRLRRCAMRSAPRTRRKPPLGQCDSCTPSRRGGTRFTRRTPTRTPRAKLDSSSPRAIGFGSQSHGGRGGMRHGLTLQPTRTCEEAPGWVFFLAMLSFDIRSLTEHAVVVDDVLSPNDPVWEESDSRPSAPVRVRGRLSPAGPGRFFWDRFIQVDVALEGSRRLGGP